MKKILIAGMSSYVGENLEKSLRNYPEKYSIDSISLRVDSWREKDFSEYDVVFHVAGIAHIKETKKNANLYYKVNRDLAYEVAQKAKIEGVKQLIFLSSMSVYGIGTGVIDKDTPVNPKSNYGKSKLEAERLIQSLENNDFKTAIIRPPMIYGKGCKGNYPRLANLALKVPLFPSIENKRSMIFIDNLCEFVRLLIDASRSGVFFPQNKEYVCTSEMVMLIAEMQGKKIRMTKLFNPILGLLRFNTINKMFGNLVYDISMSDGLCDYNECSFKESISKSELD